MWRRSRANVHLSERGLYFASPCTGVLAYLMVYRTVLIKYLVMNARNVELFFEVSLCVPEDAFEELPHPPAHSDATIKTDIITKQLKK